MNIKKISNKHLMLASILIVTFITKSIFGMTALPNYGQLPIPSAEEIEEIMKTPDFQNMMDELEKIFAEEDLQVPEKPQPIKETTRPKPPAPSIRPPKQQDIRTNFLEPVTPDSTKDKLIQKLPQEKIDAFNYFIGRFLKSINNIEKKINSFEFGISFKEYMEKIGFVESVNKINVAINQIKSKKLYRKVFFLPINTQLRKEIIDSLKESEKLEKSIKNEEKSEKETTAFMQQIAGTEKKVTKIKLNPLQKKIENLLNTNFKNIDQKISSVAINTQAIEEIEKKKKLRASKEKRAIEQQKRSPRRQRTPRHRPAYQQRYQQPLYGKTTIPRPRPRPYSGPKSWRDSYSKPYKSKETTYPSDQRTKPQTDSNQTVPGSRVQDRLSGDMKQKLNVVKNSKKEIIKLLKEIQKKYNRKKERSSINHIFKSNLLLKVKNHLIKLEEAKSSLEEKVQKQQAENKEFKNAITNFLYIGVRLAKNPEQRNQSQREIAQSIIELEPSAMISPLREYENKIFEKLEGKEDLLASFETPAKAINSIYRNFAVMNTGPQVNTEIIKTINKAFKELSIYSESRCRGLSDDIIGFLQAITENVGQQGINIGPQPAGQAGGQDLNTGTNLNNVIDLPALGIHDDIKTLFKNKVTEIVSVANMGQAFNAAQTKQIKEAFNIFITNIKAQIRVFKRTKFNDIFNKLEEAEDEE